MEEKKKSIINISTILLIIAIIVIAIMAFFIYKLNNEKNNESKRVNELQEQVINLNGTVNYLQTKINTISETINDTTKSVQSTNSTNSSSTSNKSKDDEVKYEITKIKDQSGDEIKATIKATKAGKSVTKEFEFDSLIANTGTIVLPTIGQVALIATTGGEYYGVNVYQLVNNEIKEIGTIDCGADMVPEATYSVEIKGETTAIVTANRNGETVKKEFEMSAAIAKTEVIDIFNCGKVVLVAETGGEYYAFKIFRLSQDYTNGKTGDIIEAGSIQYIF